MRFTATDIAGIPDTHIKIPILMQLYAEFDDVLTDRGFIGSTAVRIQQRHKLG